MELAAVPLEAKLLSTKGKVSSEAKLLSRVPAPPTAMEGDYKRPGDERRPDERGACGRGPWGRGPK